MQRLLPLILMLFPCLSSGSEFPAIGEDQDIFEWWDAIQAQEEELKARQEEFEARRKELLEYKKISVAKEKENSQLETLKRKNEFDRLISAPGFLEPGASEKKLRFVYVHLLPLIEKSEKSLDANPYFYPEGMGVSPLVEIVRYVKSNNLLYDFSHIPVGTPWEKLNKSDQTKFLGLAGEKKALVEDKYCYGDCSYPVSISEVWQVSRSNSDLHSYCCEESCSFKFWYGERPDNAYLNIDAYGIRSRKNKKSCQLTYGFGSVTDTFRMRITDPECSGKIDSLKSGNSEIDKAFQDSYQRLLRKLDPSSTYARTDVGGCDV